MTPLVCHPDFIPGLTDQSFVSQAPQRLMRAALLLGSTEWITTENLLSGQHPFTLDCWRINQMSNFLGSLPKPTLFTRKPHSFEELCLGEVLTRKSLSTTYKSLIDLHSTEDPPFLSKWKRNLQVTFTEPQKECILFWHRNLIYVANIRRPPIK